MSFAVLAASLLVYVAALWRGRKRLPAGVASLRLIARAVAGLAAAALALWVLFELLGLGLESHSLILWLGVCGAAAVTGLDAAACARRLPALELAIAALPLFAAASELALLSCGNQGLAAAPVRALLVAPPAFGLCAYFGASVGHLLWSAGRMDLRLGYESMVGRRFLLSKASPVLSTVTTIAIIGVTLGVWLVLVSLGVLAGFESDLERKIIGANAHVVLQRDDFQPFVVDEHSLEALQQVQNVVAAAPFLQSEVAVASYTQYTGAILFGIDPNRAQKVLAVLDSFEDGSLAGLGAEPEAPVPAQGSETDFIAPSKPANIVIGVEMAKALNVRVGDRVRLISPVLEVLTPVGAAPKSLGFCVSAIFSSKMYEYDARYAYVSLADAARFLDLPRASITGVQVRCADAERTEQVSRAVVQALHEPHLQALDWRQRNQTLFSALKLEKVVAFVVLVFIILVASFSIVNTLTMSVIEKRREIAILKTMGAHDVGIMKLFLVQGMLVGAFGTLFGVTAGVTTLKLLERFRFWIPGEVYYIDSLPVKLEAADVTLVVLAACLIVWDFAVFPALRGSRIEPVEGLRDG